VRRGTGLKTKRVSETLSGLEVLGEAHNVGTESRGSWELVGDGS